MYFELNESGGSYTTLKKKILEWEIDTSHFLGRASNRGKSPRNKVSVEDVIENKHYLKSDLVKRKLLEANLIENCCAICGLVDWNGKPLTLELDHIDSNRKNNQLENLRLLCPNCHAQTDGWRNRKCRGGGMADPQR